MRTPFARRRQQRTQAAKTVRRQDAQSDQLGDGLLELRSQQAGVAQEIVEERSAVPPDLLGDHLRARTRADAIRLRRQ
jgi:hypothetical protein